MSDISKNAESEYLLDGTPFNAPLQWEDVTINAEYPDDSIQPSLTINEFEFNLEARKIINDWIDGGLSGGVGIFEGMPFDLNLFNNNPLTENFKAFLDFTNDYNDRPDDGVLSVSIIKDESIENFFEKLGGVTCGYLEEIGVFTDADYTDIPYVVEKKFNFFEIIIASITYYLMVQALIDSIAKTVDNVNKVSIAAIPLPGVGASGPVLTVNVGGLVYAILSLLIQVIYTAILVIAIIELATSLFKALVPPKRNHKGILLKTALTKIANHFGYDFVCPVQEYNNVTYLPSNPNEDEKTFFGFISSTKGTQSGIPNQLDYGYFTEDLFNLAKSLPYAKMALYGNTIHLRAKNDPFWLQQSQWQFPDVLVNTLRYNTDEMKSTRLYSFEVDINDEWTIDNFNGTSIEVKTSPVSTIRERAVLLKGLEEVSFNTALGNRKDELNAIERLLKVLANIFDEVTSALGNGSDFAGAIESKVGVLKQSNNWHTVPKLLYLSNGKLPSNHRNLWNAPLLWDKYHKEKSFVRDNYKGQKNVYNDITIPFGLEDFFQLTTNPYFQFNDVQAKITNFEWTVGADEAKISFWVRKPYTYNLQETLIQPS